MASLFQMIRQNIGQHLKENFEEGELSEDSVVKNFFTTAADSRQYHTNHHNLDAIIQVAQPCNCLLHKFTPPALLQKVLASEICTFRQSQD
ncbi:MAG: hypothetical protein P4N59_24185 [Negativicutes bacterium]|nr:hypothetical protein [Negativicutes bacterium]